MSEIVISLVGRDPARAVTLPTWTYLAPMEGITERVFRDLVIREGGVGAACTEFLRISAAPVPSKVVRRDWRHQPTCPVGVQFMAAEPKHVAASIVNAEREGAPFIDLNFGCPAPVVFSKCAGSAMLEYPERMAELVRTAVAATTLPVTAKIRAGIAHPDGVPGLITALIESGVAGISIHGRLRCQGYHVPATWSWIAQAVAVRNALGSTTPIFGNGSVMAAADAQRMRDETGCDGVMIGRGALANPWIFREIAGGPPPTATEVWAFAKAYGLGLAHECGDRRAAARLKQFIKYVTAADVFAQREDERRILLRQPDLHSLLAWCASQAAAISSI